MLTTLDSWPSGVVPAQLLPSGLRAARECLSCPVWLSLGLGATAETEKVRMSQGEQSTSLPLQSTSPPRKHHLDRQGPDGRGCLGTQVPVLGVNQGACPHFLLQGTGKGSQVLPQEQQAGLGQGSPAQDKRHHQQLWDQQALGMAQQCSKGALGQTSHWLDPGRHQTGHKVTPGVLVGMVLAARLLGLSIHLRLRCLCSPASTL